MPSTPLSPLAGLDTASLLQGTATADRSTAAKTPANIHHAAVQFESVLLGQWLESAEKSFATVPGSEDSDDAGGEEMMSFGMQQFAAAIAKSGGLGIARLVEHGLNASTAPSASASAAVSAASSPSPRQSPAATPASAAPASFLPLAPVSPTPAEKLPYAYNFPLPY